MQMNIVLMAQGVDALSDAPDPEPCEDASVAKLRKSALKLLKSLARVNLCAGAI